MRGRSRDERKRLLRPYYRRFPLWGLGWVILPLGAFEVCVFTPHLAHFSSRWEVPFNVLGMLGFFGTWFLSLQIYLRWLNASVLRDHPTFCRSCGYDLGTNIARCPTCGTEKGK